MAPRPWLTRNLKVVSAVSLMQDAASELMYPLLPILLTTVLDAPAAVVGVIEGVAEGVAAATKVVAGRMADRFPKVPLVGLGYGLAALGKVLVAAASVWPVVLLGRGVDRVGKGVRGAPRDALLVVGIPPEQRGRAFGFHRAADTAGAVIGPLVALGGYELLGRQLRPLLWVAVVPALLSVALVALLREPPAAARPARRATAAHGPLGSSYWRVIAVLAAFSLVNLPDALVLLRLHDLGFGVVAVILAYVGYNVVYAALSYPAGALADRLSPQRVMALGVVVFAIAYAGLGLTRSRLVAVVLVAAYGVFTAFTDGVGKTWVSRLVPAGAQGSGQGYFQGISGAGVLVAGLWGGFAWGGDGRVPLVVAGAVAAVIGVTLLVVRLPARLPG